MKLNLCSILGILFLFASLETIRPDLADDLAELDELLLQKEPSHLALASKNQRPLRRVRKTKKRKIRRATLKKKPRILRKKPMPHAPMVPRSQRRRIKKHRR